MANATRAHRASKLWTQTKLAKEAGVDLSTITRAEKGQAISILSQERIARALGIARAELFPEPAQEAAV